MKADELGGIVARCCQAVKETERERCLDLIKAFPGWEKAWYIAKIEEAIREGLTVSQFKEAIREGLTAAQLKERF